MEYELDEYQAELCIKKITSGFNGTYTRGYLLAHFNKSSLKYGKKALRKLLDERYLIKANKMLGHGLRYVRGRGFNDSS